MIDYALQAIVLLIPTWLCLVMLDEARAGLRLFVAAGALLMIVIPWQLIDPLWQWSNIGYVGLFEPLESMLSLSGSAPTDLSSSTNRSATQIEWSAIWQVASVIGCAAFALVSLQHRRYLEQLRTTAAIQPHESRQYGITVIATSEPHVAFASGWLSREIWVSENILNHPQKHIALTHEAMHHQLHHPFLQWLITLVTCLLWWHPAVHLLLRQMRRDLEFQCDEHCAEVLRVSKYQQGLAQLLMDTRQGNLRLTWNARSPSIRARLAHITKSHYLGTGRRIVCTVLLALLPGSLVIVHAKQNTAQHPSSKAGGFKGWHVQMENISLQAALQDIATMGNLHVYLHPAIADHPVHIDVKNVNSVEPLLDALQIADQTTWRMRGGVYFVAPTSTIDNPGWLAEAVVLRGTGASRFQPQNPGEPAADAVYLNIRMSKVDAVGNRSTSEMAVLLNRGTPAGLRLGQERLHLTLMIEETMDAELLSVTLHAITADGRLRPIGDGSKSLQLSGTVSFEWQDGDQQHAVHIEPGPYSPSHNQG